MLILIKLKQNCFWTCTAIVIAVITLNKCNGICNTVSEVSGKTCDPSKTEDVNFSLF